MDLKQIIFVYLPPNSSNLKNGCICQFQHFHAVRFENRAELSGLVVGEAALEYWQVEKIKIYENLKKNKIRF